MGYLPYPGIPGLEREHIAEIPADAITAVELYRERDRGLEYVSAEIAFVDPDGIREPKIGLYRGQFLPLAFALVKAWFLTLGRR